MPQNDAGTGFAPNLMSAQFLEAVVIGSLMLVCAVAASLAFGVLAAYAICLAMFRVFRVHQTAVARTQRNAAAAQVALEG